MAGGDAVEPHAAFEAGLGTPAQFCRLVGCGAVRADREARQDRRLHPRPERAAPCDFDRRGDCFGQIGKERRHFRARLEPMLGRELAPVGFGHQAPFGDADQRVVRLIVLLRRKQRLVGGDERNPAFIGERDEGRLDFAFGATAVALQLDIKSVAEQPLERLATALR
jgi:hypothetical protein